MRLPLLVALTLAAGLAAGERLPDWPDCVHACNQTQHIYPESGNQERVWPACPAEDGDCRSQCADVDPNCKRYAAAKRSKKNDNSINDIGCCRRAHRKTIA